MSTIAPPPSVIRELLAYADRPGLLSLAGGLPAPELLPRAEVAEATAAVLADDAAALQYAPTEGIEALRTHLATSELGRDDAVDRVLVTSGSQQALDLLARTLDPGATVVVDDPCYVGARQAFGRRGTELHGVPVDRDGIRADVLAQRLARGLRPAIVYTVSCHHNPAGADLAPERRRSLVELADRHGFLLVEDGAYRELSFDGSRAPVLAAASDRVVTLGTVSKTLAPGLRVGWALGPPSVITRLALEKQAVDLQASTLGQHLVVALLGQEGWWAARLARLQSVYRERCAALVAALDDRFGDRIELDVPRGGLFLWARLREVDTASMLAPALDAGVAFVPGSAFAIGRDPGDRLRLSFATLAPSAVCEAVARLDSAAREASTVGAGPRVRAGAGRSPSGS